MSHALFLRRNLFSSSPTAGWPAQEVRKDIDSWYGKTRRRPVAADRRRRRDERRTPLPILNDSHEPPLFPPDRARDAQVGKITAATAIH
jgi:hypothetical protein